MGDTGLHKGDLIRGMLNTESPVMESNGDALLPDPALGQTGEWPLDQVAPDAMNNMVANENQEVPQQKTVEQVQFSSAQIILQENTAPQPPEVPPPPAEPDTTHQPMTLESKDDSEDATQPAEDGMELEEPSKEADSEVAPSLESQLPSEFEKLFTGCQDNPEDFNAWVYLLQYVEQENSLDAVRKAFDHFFLRYPYCYGYWKKYADLEKKHENIQVAEEVYRRGLQVIPLSVDLWLHYMTFIKENSDPNDPETEGRIRAAYEHAVLAAGTDFRSDRLWESYINWEIELQKLSHVTAIYDRLLGIPTQLYSQHFQKFKEHVQNNHPKHFLAEEEFVQLRVELSKASLSSMVGEDGDVAVPPEELPPGTDDLPDPAKRVTEIENMRHKVTEVRQEIFNHNEHEVSKRWAFEEAIKRPYFHVKSLEKTQLQNWKEYLDFEIENGTPERAVVLFERCLIACALYEEFWIKYAKYLESYSTDGVRHVYKKACTVHLPKKPTIHLLWAAFEEQQGQVEEARSILQSLETIIPGLAVVRLRRVSLERRHGRMEEAEALLTEALTTAKTPTEASFYAVKLARHFLKVHKSQEQAKKTLQDAIERDPANPKLYLNLLELEYNGDIAQNQTEVMSCFDRAIKSPMPLESRLLFAQRKVEFLEDFGTDVNVLVAAHDEHIKLKEESESLKRKAESVYDGTGEPDAKKQRVEDGTEPTDPAAAAAMTDMTANNSAYNYNWYQQYGTWGQNSWGQYNQYAQYNQYYPPPPT
ncbi:pre-mRNA-processing factor 39 isoform X2 [Periophthalmus magnuspinnatus]|uniref:pre-mRNA-processing factor 39 isoform X2 n=1 Tax=Periophthalmus magnuspinnatus TaxID=409849 RepID=UPI00145A03ED|nr:pre-mRNA-processing factor 39 isoform X2 [Periophthalmus magnuspinnatus]